MDEPVPEDVRLALLQYRAGVVGMRGAAEIAGLSIAETITCANEYGLLSNYGAADLDTDVDALR